jgi:hypothetical protein
MILSSIVSFEVGGAFERHAALAGERLAKHALCAASA